MYFSLEIHQLVISTQAPIQESNAYIADGFQDLHMRKSYSSNLLFELGEIRSIFPVWLSLGGTDRNDSQVDFAVVMHIDQCPNVRASSLPSSRSIMQFVSKVTFIIISTDL